MPGRHPGLDPASPNPLAGSGIGIVCRPVAIELSPGRPVVALNIPIGQWHTVRALESGTVIMEVKDGPYEPTGAEDILAL